MAHQMLRPYSFLLYFLAILTGFFVGLTYAGLVEAGKNQGLAGGAIVFGYGVMGAFSGLLIALFVANKTTRKIIFRLNIILAISIIGFYGYYHLKYLEKHKANELERKHMEQPKAPSQKIPTEPVISDDEPMALLIHNDFKKPFYEQDKDDGLGMFAPNVGDQEVLYFYGDPNVTKAIIKHAPYDSITFKKAKYGDFEIATAPPWLVPHHLKLDYGILFFKVRSITQDFVEVTVNTLTHQTAFISKQDGNISYWPEFLLGIHSVEFPVPESGTIYVKPLDYAGHVNTVYSFMKPLRIANEWMFVELQDEGFKPVGRGWIKWIKDGKLLIRYSLLS